MKVTRIESLDQAKTIFQFELNYTDIVIDRSAAVETLIFWRMVDKLAEELHIPPLCPCGERPHRIFCPLGFSNYFPRTESNESVSPAKSLKK